MKKQKPREDESEKDGGWGWVCVIGGFTMHLLLVGVERMYGMIYADLVDKVPDGAAAVAGVGGVCSAIRLGLAPIASMLSNKWSPRIVVMAGGVIMFAGVLLSAFPPNAIFLYFSWGVLVGTGGAMVYAPSFIVLTWYFKRRLALANGLSTCGTGIGTLFFPTLYAWLVDEFNFASAMMIIAAVAFNLINCGAVYRSNDKTVTVLEEADDVVEINDDNKNMDNGDCTVGIELMDKNVEKNDDNEEEEEIVPLKKRKKRLLDFSLFLNLRFMLFITSNGVVMIGCISLLAFLPAVMREENYTRQQAAYVLSLLGITDTVGRLGSGVVFAMVPVLTDRRRHVAVVFYLLIAITLSTVPSLGSMAAYCVFAGSYGLCLGMTVALMATLSTDWIRHTQPDGDVASGLGFLTLFRGIGTVVGPLTGGMLKDMTGEFSTTFYFMSAAVFLSGGIYIALICVDVILTKRNSNTKAKTSEVVS